MQHQGVSTRMPKDHEYWVYIVASASGTLYVGMTNDLGVRVRQHKAGEIEGFSKRYHCNRLVYYESYDWVHRAIDRKSKRLNSSHTVISYAVFCLKKKKK